ncbi:hypothetical protein NPIL_680941 [Nephila pilipes]|uniref:Uncharacterized protein n=1 Tax=Nephila pilipes TaxID=299642 RepID=A0A8X6MNH4_NEPPI|nr:hypothetical protein NPIL_680941 [Nephila pilipes]
MKSWSNPLSKLYQTTILIKVRPYQLLHQARYSEEFFAVNFTMTRRAIQGRNAYAAWARKLGTTKKDDPEFLRVHEELRKSGENLDKVLSQMGDIPLFKLPASEKELDQLVENYKNPAKHQEEAVPKVIVTPLRQDRPESASQAKKPTKRVRDSVGFISPPKHLTRKAPKANPNAQIATTMNVDANPDVDINTLDPVVAETPPKSPKIPPPFSLARRGIGGHLLLWPNSRPLPFSPS